MAYGCALWEARNRLYVRRCVFVKLIQDGKEIACLGDRYVGDSMPTAAACPGNGGDSMLSCSSQELTSSSVNSCGATSLAT